MNALRFGDGGQTGFSFKIKDKSFNDKINNICGIGLYALVRTISYSRFYICIRVLCVCCVCLFVHVVLMENFNSARTTPIYFVICCTRCEATIFFTCTFAFLQLGPARTIVCILLAAKRAYDRSSGDTQLLLNVTKSIL